MSVLARYRSESPFEVRDNAKVLEAKIYKYCMNEKYFPKRHRFTLTNYIIEAAHQIPKAITEANKTSLIKDPTARMRYQNHAYVCCEEILRLLDLADEIGLSIPDGIMTETIELVIKEEKLITDWAKSDENRAKR